MTTSAEYITWIYETDTQDDWPDPERCPMAYALQEVDSEPAYPVMARELAHVPKIEAPDGFLDVPWRQIKIQAAVEAEQKEKERRRRKALKKKADALIEKKIQERLRAHVVKKLTPPSKKFVAPPVDSRKDALRQRISDLNGALGKALASPLASQETIDELKAMRQRASRQLREIPA